MTLLVSFAPCGRRRCSGSRTPWAHSACHGPDRWIGNVPGAEHLLRSPRLRQHVHDDARFLHRGAEHLLEEVHRQVHAAEGDAVVILRGGCQALQATLGSDRRAHPMHGDGRVVVDPDDVLAVRVDAGLGLESACGRCLLFRTDLRERLVADARGAVIADCGSQQGRRCRDELTTRIERVDAGSLLVGFVQEGNQWRTCLLDGDRGRSAYVESVPCSRRARTHRM